MIGMKEIQNVKRENTTILAKSPYHAKIRKSKQLTVTSNEPAIYNRLSECVYVRCGRYLGFAEFMRLLKYVVVAIAAIVLCIAVRTYVQHST